MSESSGSVEQCKEDIKKEGIIENYRKQYDDYIKFNLK